MRKTWFHRIVASWVAVMALAACQPVPTEGIVLGGVLDSAQFDDVLSWENYSNAAQRVDFRIEDGAYRARAWDGAISWALNAQQHADVVIQADTLQLSDYANNAYGLMCRAAPTNNGNGYYFFISGDGFYTIRRGAADEVNAIIPWTRTDAIQQGRGINRIRIVCIEDYLALTVNGVFVAEARDDRYTSGYAGLTAAAPPGGEVDVQFDDLTIRAAALAGEETQSP